MTFTELLKDIFESSRDRIKTPLTSSYIIAFTIINWRPILLLLLSNSSIENRIKIINEEYCSAWTIFIPFIIALFYITIVPYISVVIDSFLIKANRIRQNQKYNDKINEVNLKINLAGVELKLQDKLSRKQETEELLNKISELEAKNSNDLEANKAIIEGYKAQVKDLTKNLNDSLRSKNLNSNDIQYGVYENLRANEKLTFDELLILSMLPDNSDIPIGIDVGKRLENFLDKYNFRTKTGSLYYMTKTGLDFRLHVKNYTPDIDKKRI